MITTKQRATLRALANGIDTLFQVGKGGINEAMIESTKDALTARELIKLRVLETSPLGTREAATKLAEACGAEIVQVIGSKFVLYKKHPKEPKIKL